MHGPMWHLSSPGVKEETKNIYNIPSATGRKTDLKYNLNYLIVATKEDLNWNIDVIYPDFSFLDYTIHCRKYI
jgi:hypothetical protein